MCALCGGLGGGDHWTDATARPGVFSNAADPLQRRRARARRIASANRVLAAYAMRLADWQGSAYILTTATGKRAMVDDLAHLWTVAETLAARPCDPLDTALLARLEASDG